MIIDCHFHLDTEIVTVENLLKSMEAHAIDRVALMARLTPPLVFGDSVLEQKALTVFQKVIHNEKNPLIGLVRQGYAKSVKGDCTVNLAGRIYRLFPQPDNDATMKACQDYPDRFHGWIVINPKGGADPVVETDRFLKAPGMVGVKVHPYWYNIPVSMLQEAAELCAQKAKPMIIHLGLGECGDFRLLPEKFPQLKVIYCHAGIPFPNPVCAYAREKENVYVDLSGSAFMNPKAAAKAIQLAGSDKCLFGSDGPYHHDKAGMFDFGFYTRMIESVGLSDKDLEKIFSLNFLRVVGSS